MIRWSVSTPADKKQFKEYQATLDKVQLPDALAKFQQMKYTEPETCADVKYYAWNKGERPLWYIKVDRELVKAVINREQMLFRGADRDCWMERA